MSIVRNLVELVISMVDGIAITLFSTTSLTRVMTMDKS